VDKITIINYQMGNIGSIAKKIKRIGFEPVISVGVDDIKTASKLILPGVGHFAKGVDNLKKMGLWDALNQTVLEKKTPILGICLGMQLMAKHSEEGNNEGLGWFDAEVKHFDIKEKQQYKVPHTGWNTLKKIKPNVLTEEINKNDEFYFVHSYYLQCNNENDILTRTKYENQFVSGIQKENIYGVQFHPEKSHDVGERLLRNFIGIGHFGSAQ